jgi:hypothetical protein
MRAAKYALAALLLSNAAAAADGPPELFASMPADLSYVPYAVFEPGFAINGAGAIVPAAYATFYSISGLTFVPWTTDGTAAGTHAAAPSTVSAMQMLPSRTLGAFFIGATTGTSNWQVFRTDGVDYMVGPLDDMPLIQRVDAIAGTTTFSTVDPDTGELSDVATVPGMYVQAFTNGETVFVVREPGPEGDPIAISSFRRDAEPTVLPVPPPSTEWDDPHQFDVGPRLACFENFTEYTPENYVQELYCTDGSAAGTRRPVPPPYARGVLLLDNVMFWPVGERLVFKGRADGESALPLWSTDGTDAGTVKLDDGVTTLSGEAPCTDDRAGGLYYIAGDGSDASLAFTDGTPAGTRMLITLPANAYCYGRGTAARHGGTTWMRIDDTLYQSDGTAAGTHPVEGAPAMSGYAETYLVPTMASLGNRILFSTPNADGTLGLWRIELDHVFTDGFDAAN